MALKVGIVGLPNVGKSTLFNALGSGKAQAANFPFCTIEPNIGMVNVPDERLNKLSDLVKPQKLIPTTMEFVDIAGLVKGASKGEGLGNQFLGNIRNTNAIIHVVRCFENENVVHVDGSVDPVRDKEVIDTELQLKDLESIEKKLEKSRRAAKTGDKAMQAEVGALETVQNFIEEGKNVRDQGWDEAVMEAIDDLDLLSAKPVLYVCNVDEASVSSGNKHSEALKERVKNEPAELCLISADIESEIAQLETKEEQMLFLEEMGLKNSGLVSLINSSYALLELITYFTAGEKEVRAWTIRNGTQAPGAAGVIHTDFETGFIRAEVIGYNDFVSLGSEAKVKEAGKMRVEGKDYVVADGDVMHFRFNV